MTTRRPARRSTPSHTFAVDGTYTVTLIVTDVWGRTASTTRVVTIAKPAGNLPPVPVIGAPSCVARVCSMSSAGSADPNGDAFTYLWNFGDGTATSTASAPSHTFPGNGPYTVTLTLTDAWGDASAPPATRVVSFTAPPTNGAPVPVIDAPSCTIRSCTFSAIASSDPDGDTFTYLWNFGDLTATNTGSAPVHAYAVDGTYTVTLTLTDVWGAAASTTRVVTIAKPATNLPPIPVINPVVCAARACTIYGVSSSDPNSDAFTYLWNFGDGTATSTSTNPAHTFAADDVLHGDAHRHRCMG